MFWSVGRVGVSLLPEMLSGLGVVKNPVLFASTSFSAMVLYFSHDFVMGGHMMLVVVCGFIMFLLAIAIFLSGAAFYVYAYLHLPSTTQEKGIFAGGHRSSGQP